MVKKIKNIYLFSGLGADHRVYKHLDFTGYDIVHVKWETPIVNETLADYVKRLAQQVTRPNPVFIGVSFGGMVAIEMAKIIDTEKIIIIASAKDKYNIPIHYKISGFLKIHKLIPGRVLKRPSQFLYWQFGIETTEDKKLLDEILPDTDVKFLTWALGRISTWSNTKHHSNLVHIHGSEDRVLPYPSQGADFTIKDGGHFMMINRANEISVLLQQILSTS